MLLLLLPLGGCVWPLTPPMQAVWHSSPVEVDLCLLPQPTPCIAAFYEMNAAHQQRHAQRLVKLLQQGKHAMVAAHIRACLQRQGVLPAAGAAAGRGQAAAEASAEGSGVG